jgi:putative SOS response-associated peptidase YedK
MINARAEIVSRKASFRNVFRKRRCLIPADGFYEWKGEKGDKQPYFVTIPSAEPLHLPDYGKHGLIRKVMMILFTNPARS